MKEPNGNQQLDLEIFRATSEDFDALTDISQVCFPEQLRWRGPKSHSRKWWNILTNAEYCEIWVCSSSGQVIAFTVLVFDRTRYEDAWEEHRLNFFDTLYIFMTCPKRSMKRAFIKLKRNRIKKLHKPNEPFTKNGQINSYEKIRKYFAENNPWCGPSAVVPSMRGKGISTKIHEFSFQRAIELGYKEVYTAVKRKNIMSRVMVAILGFVIIDEIDHVLFYKKTLEAK